MKDFSFFGAPHVAVITTDRYQGVRGANEVVDLRSS